MKIKTNKLYIGNQEDFLTRLDDEMINLVYLDPPFFSEKIMKFLDKEEATYRNEKDYFEYITKLLIQSHRILKNNGAIVYRDSSSSILNIRLFLDRIFSHRNFRAEIILENRQFGHIDVSYPRMNFEKLFIYSRSDIFTFNNLKRHMTLQEIKENFRHHDTNGYYKLWNLIDNIERTNRYFTWNNITPPKGSSWKYSFEKLEEFKNNGEIEIHHNKCYRKVYATNKFTEIPLSFIWGIEQPILTSGEFLDQILLNVIRLTTSENDLVFTPFTSPVLLSTLKSSKREWLASTKIDFVSSKFNQSELIHEADLTKYQIVSEFNLPNHYRRFIDTEINSLQIDKILPHSGRKIGFLVGINHYKDNFLPLNYCTNDVVVLGQVLKKHNYEVTILNDNIENDNLIPLKSNIETELIILTESLVAEDTLFVHFSCHGSIYNNEAILIASDTRNRNLSTTSLQLNRVIEIMKSGRAKKLVLSLDVCYAGVNTTRGIDENFLINVYQKAEGFALLAAGTSDQVVFEIEEFQHGLYSYFLINGLDGNADFDCDGRISVEDIRNYVLNSIRERGLINGQHQDPTYRCEGIGEILLVQ